MPPAINRHSPSATICQPFGTLRLDHPPRAKFRSKTISFSLFEPTASVAYRLLMHEATLRALRGSNGERKAGGATIYGNPLYLLRSTKLEMTTKRQEGFSLIELLIVVAIIGIIA